MGSVSEVSVAEFGGWVGGVGGRDRMSKTGCFFNYHGVTSRYFFEFSKILVLTNFLAEKECFEGVKTKDSFLDKAFNISIWATTPASYICSYVQKF